MTGPWGKCELYDLGMATEAEETRRDDLLARVGELHVLADDLNRAEDEASFDRTLVRIEELVQVLREL